MDIVKECQHVAERAGCKAMSVYIKVSYKPEGDVLTIYAVVGAVVSEWLGGFNGLGVYMTRVKKAYAFDKMFAVIIFIVLISLLLLFAVNVIRQIAMPLRHRPWQHPWHWMILWELRQ